MSQGGRGISLSALTSIVDSTTTVELRKSVVTRLKRMKDPVMDRSLSDVIERLLGDDPAVFVKVWTIDGFLADSSEHEMIFQLGEDPPHYYRYRNGKFEELDKLPKIRTEVV